MKKLRSKLPRLKKGQRLARNLLIILFLGLYLLVAADFPTNSAERAFRRLEKSWLVGPSEILNIYDCNYGREKIVVAEYEGDILLGRIMERTTGLEGTSLIFNRGPEEGVMLLPLPEQLGTYEEGYRTALLIFDDFPQAVRCEVTVGMQESWTINGAGPYDFDREYTMSADRGEDGMFLLYLEEQAAKGTWAHIEYLMFERLREMSQQFGSSSYSFPATVRLYGESGELIAEIETEIKRDRV